MSETRQTAVKAKRAKPAAPPSAPKRASKAPKSASQAATPLEESLGHAFQRSNLLTLALTHRSCAHEAAGSEIAALTRPAGEDNEQLEFLGDAVLGLLVAETLLQRFPTAREGDLTRLRAAVVSRTHLAEVAGRLQLGEHLRLGRGEERTGGRRKPALLADATEAVLAAIYLDSGLDAARRFVLRHIVEPAVAGLADALASGNPVSGSGDYKTALQEMLQGSGAAAPDYVLAAQTGPDHQRRFRVEVRVRTAEGATRVLADAEGSSKKQAQQIAARAALELLERERTVEASA